MFCDTTLFKVPMKPSFICLHVFSFPLRFPLHSVTLHIVNYKLYKKKLFPNILGARHRCISDVRGFMLCDVLQVLKCIKILVLWEL